MDTHHLPFRPVAVSGAPSTDARLADIIRWGRAFDRLGLAPSYGTGSHGNVSIRTAQGCLMSATRTFLGTITAAQFVEVVRCDVTTQPATVEYRGALLPSTDSLIHWHLYQWRPEVACVLHAHDALVLEHAAALNLSQTPREADAGSSELLTMIKPLAHHPYFLVKRHGFVATGRTADEAGALALAAHQQAEVLAHKKIAPV